MAGCRGQTQKKRARGVKDPFKGLARCVRERRPPYLVARLADLIKPVWIRVFPGFGYQLPYWVSSKLYRPSAQEPELDILFVFKKEGPGWILEGICREIARYFNGRYAFHYADNSHSLPPAKTYYFSHYSFFPKCFRRTPSIWGSRCLVWYPHEKRSPHAWHRNALLYALKRPNVTVVCPCSQNVKDLVREGLDPARVKFVLGGADPDLFRAHQRSGQGAAGFCTAYYPRKCPDKMLEIMRLLPHRRFILLGPRKDAGAPHRHWSRYPRFDEMLALPNFTYAEAPYAEYPSYYERMDVLVSVSTLEGGPIPVLEAMMANVVPVASRTGFCPDLIRDGENGFLFNVDAPASQIALLVDRAFACRADVRASVEHLSWKNFSIEMQKLLGFDPSPSAQKESAYAGR